MEPINYNIDVQSPFQAALQGFQGGLAIRNAEQQAAAQKEQIVAQQAQRARQQQMQRELATVSQNPSTENIARISVAYPELSEQLKRSFDMTNPGEQAAKLSHGMQVYFALNSGKSDVAEELLRKQALAEKNSGNTRAAQAATAMADSVKLNPQFVQANTGALLSAVMGPDKFSETFAKLGDEARKNALAPAEQEKAVAEASLKTTEAVTAPEKIRVTNANIRSEIANRIGRLGLDRDKLQSEMQLELYKLNQQKGTIPEDARKIVNSATMDAAVSAQGAAKLNSLATRVEEIGSSWGKFSSAKEGLASLLGNETAYTDVRNEYTRLANSAAIKAFRSSGATGATSDKDIKFAMEGVPEATAKPERMAQFLRGMAKLQDLDAATQSAQAEWVSEVHSLAKAPRDIEVAGVKVPAGMTFDKFAQKVIERKVKENETMRTIQSAPYGSFAAPQQQGATGTY